MNKFGQIEDFPEDDYYLARMEDILEGYPKLGPLQHPSKLIEHVYIGNQDNADNLDLLQALEITHVLNCAGTRTFDLTRSPYRKETGIVGFLMMPAEDYEEFNIIHYFLDAIVFLDKVKAAGGRALVHCNIGVNRSGAIVAAYLMVYQKRPLLQVIEDLKSKRSLILQNKGFRRQLIRFARCRGLLDIAERPPKKLSAIVNGCTIVNKEPAIATNQEKNETVKSVSNGTSNVAEEVPKESQEPAAKGNNEINQFSKETSGEQSSGCSDEQKSPVPNSNGAGKSKGSENDPGNLEDKTLKQYSKFSNLDAPGRDSSEDKTDKSYNRISYLDLGNSRPFIKAEHLLLNESATPLNEIINSSSQFNKNSRDQLNAKLSALSLEVPTFSFRGYRAGQNLSYDSRTKPYLDLVEDIYPSYRASAFDKTVSPALSLSLRVSRESSDSDITNSMQASLDDEDLTGKYNASRKFLAPISSTYFEYDGLPWQYPIKNLSKAAPKTIPTFISSVKPLSYYHKLARPIGYHELDDFDSQDSGFSETVQSSFDRRSFSKTRPFSGGSGMLFTPHLASSKSPTGIRRNSLTSDIFDDIDKTYATGNVYSRNIPYNRNSLSDLDTWSSGRYGTYRPSTNYRSTAEYDDALDEYSDLLEGYRGRSQIIGSGANSRVRSRAGSRFRKSYK